MNSPLEADADPSVCYRHPDRQSWILCQRCGRTICPECQILAPVGVQCPECVREAGGSVKWSPTGGSRLSAAASVRRQPRWLRWVTDKLNPADGRPIVSWGIAAVSILLWVVGLFTNLAFLLLAGDPSRPLELWRFVTSIVTFIPGFDFRLLFFFAISMVFWLLNAPSAERTLGRARFVTTVLASTIVGTVAMFLFGQPNYGLGPALFGVFGAYLVVMWSIPSARMQILIMLGLNLLINVFFGGFSIPAIIGGVLAGAGVTYLIRRYDGMARSKPARPYQLIALGLAALIVIAVARLLLAPVGYVLG